MKPAPERISGDYPEYKSWVGLTEKSALDKYFKEFGKKEIVSDSSKSGIRTIGFSDGTSVLVSERIAVSNKGKFGDGHTEYTVSSEMEIDPSAGFSQSDSWRRNGFKMWEPNSYYEKGKIGKELGVVPTAPKENVQPMAEALSKEPEVLQPVAKEPWQMTRDEILAKYGDRVEYGPSYDRVWLILSVTYYHQYRRAMRRRLSILGKS